MVTHFDANRQQIIPITHHTYACQPFFVIKDYVSTRAISIPNAGVLPMELAEERVRWITLQADA